jgi:hypothetical protein
VVVSFLIGNATARFFFINCLQSEELLQNKLKRISIGGHLVERYDGMPASTELRISARLIWGLKNVATVGLVKVESTFWILRFLAAAIHRISGQRRRLDRDSF